MSGARDLDPVRLAVHGYVELARREDRRDMRRCVFIFLHKKRLGLKFALLPLLEKFERDDRKEGVAQDVFDGFDPAVEFPCYLV